MRPARPNARYRIALAIDRRLGSLLCSLLLGAKALRRTRPEQRSGEVQRILLLKMWGMGSIVLVSSIFQEARRLYPNARIDVITLHENLSLLELYSDVDRKYSLDLSQGVFSFLWQTLTMLRRLRSEHYDLLLDLEFFTRFSAIFSFLSGARRTHGFSAKSEARGRLHDVEVPFNSYQHVAVNFRSLLRGAAMEPSPREEILGRAALPLLEAPAEAWDRCRALLEAAPGFDPNRPIVALNPNAGDMALERRWPAERMLALLRELANESVNLVLTGSPGERAYVESIANEPSVAGRIVSVAGLIGIPELIALFAHARVVVSNDSGPLHLAAAAGTDTVALFGPETPVLYGPLLARKGQIHSVHYRGLACSPCMFVHDNKELSCWFANAVCLTGIEPSEVLESVHARLRAP
jgi:lipopolysaccharide heptosyltransferase II